MNFDRLSKVLNKAVSKTQGQVQDQDQRGGKGRIKPCDCPMNRCHHNRMGQTPDAPITGSPSTCDARMIVMQQKCNQCRNREEKNNCMRLANFAVSKCKSAMRSCNAKKEKCDSGNDPSDSIICQCHARSCSANDIYNTIFSGRGCMSDERYERFMERRKDFEVRNAQNCQDNLRACRRFVTN